MSGPGFAGVFDANLPDLAWPVRINAFFDAQVFVRRWVIRDKDPAMRVLLRRMEKANSSEAVAAAIKELKRELAVRGRTVARRAINDPVSGKSSSSQSL